MRQPLIFAITALPAGNINDLHVYTYVTIPARAPILPQAANIHKLARVRTLHVASQYLSLRYRL